MARLQLWEFIFVTDSGFAEMNADITVLRIFDDYIKELGSKQNEPKVKRQDQLFSKTVCQFQKRNKRTERCDAYS
jgi:hypothetical protein